MRIWSLHPKYLDAKGLVALWRETLLAKHVLEGRTKGYNYHPQLLRFKEVNEPVDAINQYLESVYEEALCRGYNFEGNKIGSRSSETTMQVTTGQLSFERKHLLSKLQIRDSSRYQAYHLVKDLDPHPLFVKVEGPVADWEKM